MVDKTSPHFVKWYEQNEVSASIESAFRAGYDAAAGDLVEIYEPQCVAAEKSIEEYKVCVDKWRLWYDNASEDAKNWRRDAQELQGVLSEIKAELQGRNIHLLSKHCWCSPEGHSWTQKGTIAE